MNRIVAELKAALLILETIDEHDKNLMGFSQYIDLAEAIYRIKGIIDTADSDEPRYKEYTAAERKEVIRKCDDLMADIASMRS